MDYSDSHDSASPPLPQQPLQNLQPQHTQLSPREVKLFENQASLQSQLRRLQQQVPLPSPAAAAAAAGTSGSTGSAATPPASASLSSASSASPGSPDRQHCSSTTQPAGESLSLMSAVRWRHFPCFAWRITSICSLNGSKITVSEGFTLLLLPRSIGHKVVRIAPVFGHFAKSFLSPQFLNEKNRRLKRYASKRKQSVCRYVHAICTHAIVRGPFPLASISCLFLT